MSDLLAERARLRGEVAEAEQRVGAAERDAAQEWQIGAELMQPLWARRYEKSRPTDWLVEFTDELIAKVREGGLAFDLSNIDRSVVIFDPAIRDEREAAQRALADARRALRRFEIDHADGLAAQEEAAEAQSIRDALAGNDPEAMRQALAGAAR